MKYFFYFLCVLTVTYFSSCLSKGQLNTKDDLIYIESSILKQGHEFTFFYNSNNKKAKFKDTNELYAGLCFHSHGYLKFYIVKMENENNGLNKGKFIVPEKATKLSILIAEKNKLSSMNRDEKEFPIYNSKGIITKESLNYLLLSSKNFDNYKKLLILDSTYYYNNYDREFILAKLQSENGTDSLFILKRIDYLERILKSEYSRNYPVKVNIISNLINIYQLMGDWNNAFRNIDSLFYYLKNNSKCDFSFNDYELNIIEMPFFSVHSKFMKQPSQDIYFKLINKYVELAYFTNSQLLETYILRNLDFNNFLSRKTPNNSTFIEHYVANIKSNFINGYYDAFLTFPDIFLTIYNYYDRNNEYEQNRILINYALEFEQKFSTFRLSKDTNDFLSFRMGDDWIDSYKFGLSENYSKSGMADSAKQIALELFAKTKKNSGYFEGSVYINLLKLYLKENLIDSSEYFLTKLYSINDTRCSENLKLLNDYKVKNKKDTISEIDFINKVGVKYLEMENLSELNLKINDRMVNTSIFKDTAIILLNINDECAVCNQFVPEIKKMLSSDIKNGKCKLIYISNLPENKLNDAFGNQIIISRRTDEVIKKLQMNSKEWYYIYIIKNNKYLAVKNYVKELSWYKHFF
jgi:hypothetical protein